MIIPHSVSLRRGLPAGRQIQMAGRHRPSVAVPYGKGRIALYHLAMKLGLRT